MSTRLSLDGLRKRFVRPLSSVLSYKPEKQSTSIVLIALCVLLIGLFDYVTGAWLSLLVFYIVPICFAASWLGLPAAFVTTITGISLRVTGDYVLDAPYAHHPTVYWNQLILLSNYMIVAWVWRALILLQRDLGERVSVRTAALAEETKVREKLQQELMETSERERRTIGNDLHDGLGQHLTAMAYAAQILSQRLDNQNNSFAKEAHEIVRLAEEGILQSRQLARGLLLTVIEPANLSLELAELAASVQQQSGVRCYYDRQEVPLVGDSTTASHIFRIAQEAVRNSIRHANPSAVNLSLTRDDKSLVLTVSDNGSGLSTTNTSKNSVGLRVMAQRAKMIGGEFAIQSTPSRGTIIHCRVPLPAAIESIA